METTITPSETAIKTLPSVALHTDAATLLARVETAIAAVAKRSTIPILEYLLIEQDEDGEYRVTGTDLDIAIQAGRISGEVTARTCYAARELRDALKVAKKHAVSLVDGKLTTPLGETTISTLGAESYPEIPRIEVGATVVPFREFGQALKYILPCISDEESRFTLNAALVDVPNGCIVATDSHRLGRRRVAMEGGSAFKIRRKLVDVIAKQSARSCEVCCIGHSDHHTAYQSGDVVYIDRKPTGNFPDYERVIPSRWECSMTASAKSLRTALEAIKSTVPKETMLVKLESGAVSTATVRATFHSVGDVLTAGFNWRYVMDALEGDDIVIRWNTWERKGGGPGVHGTREVGATMFGDTVIMPIRA